MRPRGIQRQENDTATLRCASVSTGSVKYLAKDVYDYCLKAGNKQYCRYPPSQIARNPRSCNRLVTGSPRLADTLTDFMSG